MRKGYFLLLDYRGKYFTILKIEDILKIYSLVVFYQRLEKTYSITVINVVIFRRFCLKVKKTTDNYKVVHG